MMNIHVVCGCAYLIMNTQHEFNSFSILVVKCMEVKHMSCIPCDIADMMGKTLYPYLSSVTFVEREKHSFPNQIVSVKTSLTVDNISLRLSNFKAINNIYSFSNSDFQQIVEMFVNKC